MKRPLVWGALLSVGLSALALGAAVRAAAPPKVQFTDTRLKNGLRVIISEDHTAPVFSIAITYNVGSRNERPGRTGFAHLFEHMMFKGSPNVGSGEHFSLVFNNGGDMNGSTSKDRTNYYETDAVEPARPRPLPRVGPHAGARHQQDESRQPDRHGVQEERQHGVDNQPYGRTSEAVDELAYTNFAYEHSVIGSMADLRRRDRRRRGGVLPDLLRAEQCRADHRRRRRPTSASRRSGSTSSRSRRSRRRRRWT